jgi:hypothetical protein
MLEDPDEELARAAADWLREHAGSLALIPVRDLVRSRWAEYPVGKRALPLLTRLAGGKVNDPLLFREEDFGTYQKALHATDSTVREAARKLLVARGDAGLRRIMDAIDEAPDEEAAYLLNATWRSLGQVDPRLEEYVLKGLKSGEKPHLARECRDLALKYLPADKLPVAVLVKVFREGSQGERSGALEKLVDRGNDPTGALLSLYQTTWGPDSRPVVLSLVQRVCYEDSDGAAARAKAFSSCTPSTAKAGAFTGRRAATGEHGAHRGSWRAWNAVTTR